MNSDKTLIAFLAGAAAGAVVGLLMAPDSGRITRDKLSRQADQLVNDLEDQWEVGFQKIRELTNSALAEADLMKERSERAMDDNNS